MMSIRDGERLPHRRISTGSDLMKYGDRMIQKGYNGFIKLFREQSASGQRKKQTTLLLVSAHSSGLHTDFHQLNQIASG